MSTVISVENVSKLYYIGRSSSDSGNNHPTLRESLGSFLKQPLKSLKRTTEVQVEELWALQDINFTVEQGEIVGIVGRNGAGKSTLLKILSRITQPTSGRIELHGRVGSLIEVGTGFHPELTGRENVFLNGAILGMKRREILDKFDEIVSFAELERFIDTPVKYYSSGMYMRLAFAVAAHLEPEILIVDEVLSVGDAAFQKKCLGKMEQVASGGRTVLYVSHALATVQRLCTSAILLTNGKIETQGPTEAVTSCYLDQTNEAGTKLYWEREVPATSPAYFERVYLADESDQPVNYVSTASTLRVVLEFVLTKSFNQLQLGIGLLDDAGGQIFGSVPEDSYLESPKAAGRYQAVMQFPPEILLGKTYGLKAMLYVPTPEMFDCVNSLRFEVQETASLGNNVQGGRAGFLAVRCDWHVQAIGDARVASL